MFFCSWPASFGLMVERSAANGENSWCDAEDKHEDTSENSPFNGSLVIFGSKQALEEILTNQAVKESWQEQEENVRRRRGEAEVVFRELLRGKIGNNNIPAANSVQNVDHGNNAATAGKDQLNKVGDRNGQKPTEISVGDEYRGCQKRSKRLVANAQRTEQTAGSIDLRRKNADQRNEGKERTVKPETRTAVAKFHDLGQRVESHALHLTENKKNAE